MRNMRRTRDYGDKIAFDPQWKGPLEVARKLTDPKAFILFVIFLFIWFAVGIYALSLDVHIESTSEEFSVAIILKFILVIIFCTILSAILSVIFIYMLTKWAKTIVYTIFFIIWFIMLLCIIFISIVSQKAPDLDRAPYLITMGILSVVLVGSICLVVFFHRKIDIACGIIKESSRATVFFPSHFSIALFLCVVGMVISIFWCVIGLKLYFYTKNNSDHHAESFFLQIYNFCEMIWVYNFIRGMEILIYSTSFSTWYWTMTKDNVPSNTVSESISIVMRYHKGTAAFGSAIITICEVIQSLLNSAENTDESDRDAVVIFIQACISCCCRLILDFIEFVSRNAYVMCATHGKDFLTSAKTAFNLIMRNLLTVVVTTRVTGVLLSMAMFMVFIIPPLLIWVVVHADEQVAIVVILAMFFSYSSAYSIFGVLQTAIETIFLNALEDLERNGSGGKPLYMSPELKELLLND